MLPVYVNSNGEIFREVFNAIAVVVGSSTFSSLVHIAGVFAVISLAVMLIQKRNLMDILKAYAHYFILVFLLLGIKTSIHITDTSDPMRADLTVDNVPYGLAVPASAISTVGSALVTLFDAVFHMPNDMSYAKTGVLFGASLMKESNGLSIPNPADRKLFNDYFSNCVVGDITINHKYTMNDLVNSKDILSLITSKPSPVRGLYTDGQYQTCQQAATMLKQNFLNNPSLLTSVNKRIKANIPVLSGQVGTKNVGTDVANAYQYFGNMSQSAQQILVQNMLIDGSRAGIKNFMTNTDSTAGLVSYTATSAWQHQLLSLLASGQVAQKYMPVLFTVVNLLLFALFPLILIMSIATGRGVKYFGYYIGSFAWLWTWPIFYTILNFIASFVMKTQTMGLLEGSGLTLSNSNQVASISTTIVGISGYLMMAIPFLTRGLYTGMAATFTQTAQYLGSSLHGSVNAAASSAATGNFNLGNISENNLNANKFDANRTHFEGASSWNMANNATMTRTPGGGSVLNTSGATSVLPESFNINQAERQSINMEQQKLTSLSDTQSRAINQGISGITGIVDQAGQSLGDIKSYGTGTASSQDIKASEAFSNLQSTVHDFAKSQGVSDQQAWGLVVGAQAHANWNDPGVIKAITGADAGGGVSIKGSHDSRWASNVDAAEKFAADHRASISNDISAIKSAHLSQNTSTGHSSTLSSMHQLQSTFNQLDSASESYNQTLAQSQNLSQRADALKSASVDQNANEAQAYQNFINNNYPGQASKLFDPNNANVMQDNQPYVKEFIEQQSLSPTGHNLGVNPSGDYASGQSAYDRASSSISAGQSAIGSSLHNSDSDIYNTSKNSAMASANHVAYQQMYAQKQEVVAGSKIKNQAIQDSTNQKIHGEKHPNTTSISALRKSIKGE